MWKSVILGASLGFLGLIATSGALSYHQSPDGPTIRDNGTANGTERWGYVDVRPQAHMFWWLYKTYHSAGYLNRPWIIWLQGGPGSSSCGYGNFELLGPIDVDLNPRQETWVNDVSVVFLDQPVGTGYSYVDDPSAYTTTNNELAIDMVTWTKVFLTNYPEFQTIPLYIFGESYGGKMGSEFALELTKASDRGEVTVDLRGMANGNAWISPEDSTMEWAPLARYIGAVDEDGYANIQATADETKALIDSGQWLQATNEWFNTELVLFAESNSIDIYNFLKFTGPPPRNRSSAALKPADLTKEEALKLAKEHVLGRFETQNLDDIMNNEIREKLGIIPSNVTWDGQGGDVFNQLSVDFMKPVIHILDEILETTDLELTIYEGILDIICLTEGAKRIVNKMTWSDIELYKNSTRDAYEDPANTETGVPMFFFKAYNNFKFYWITNAGHMVPKDQPRAGRAMLDRVVFDVDR